MGNTESSRYFCNIRVDSTFNAGNLPKQNIRELNDLITNAITEWTDKMTREKGLAVDIGWSWSENIDLGE